MVKSFLKKIGEAVTYPISIPIKTIKAVKSGQTKTLAGRKELVKSHLKTVGTAGAIGGAIALTPYAAPVVFKSGVAKAAGAKLGAAAVTIGTVAALAPKTFKKVAKEPAAAKTVAAGVIAGPIVGATVGAEQGFGIGEKIKSWWTEQPTKTKVKTALGAGAAALAAAGAAAMAIPKVREKTKEKIKDVFTSTPPKAAPITPMSNDSIIPTPTKQAQKPIEAQITDKKPQPDINIRITNKMAQNQKVYKRGRSYYMNYYGNRKK